MENHRFTDPPFKTPLIADRTGLPFDLQNAPPAYLHLGWVEWLNSACLLIQPGPYVVPISNGTATPDASRPVNVLMISAAMCLIDGSGNRYINIARPLNYPLLRGIAARWELVIQQVLEEQWTEAKYAPGDTVSFNGVNYVSILASAGCRPDADRGYWKAIEGYSAVFDSTYSPGLAVATRQSVPDTQSIVSLRTISTGASGVSDQSLDLPISE
ncbi:MAG TPA: hypothetical protein VG297_24260 [Bryobacteraceae bacterium]|jgi:hypothetical protein|nr:hypothetical protein [Bryobacteraceae bacterium]